MQIKRNFFSYQTDLQTLHFHFENKLSPFDKNIIGSGQIPETHPALLKAVYSQVYTISGVGLAPVWHIRGMRWFLSHIIIKLDLLKGSYKSSRTYRFPLVTQMLGTFCSLEIVLQTMEHSSPCHFEHKIRLEIVLIKV